MKRVVWKFPLPNVAAMDLRMPKGAQLLHVDHQHRSFCVWALVDPDAPPVNRVLRLAGTGHEMDEWSPDWKFVGTFLVEGGVYVFHLWDRGERS